MSLCQFVTFWSNIALKFVTHYIYITLQNPWFFNENTCWCVTIFCRFIYAVLTFWWKCCVVIARTSILRLAYFSCWWSDCSCLVCSLHLSLSLWMVWRSVSRDWRSGLAENPFLVTAAALLNLLSPWGKVKQALEILDKDSASLKTKSVHNVLKQKSPILILHHPILVV